MSFLDWLRIPKREEPSGLSRREFFARVAGLEAAPADAPSPAPAPPEPEPGQPRVLHRFAVAAFPYHDGPVLVPLLRAGQEFTLAAERNHPTDGTAVRVEWRRDHLGYVPPHLSEEIRGRMERGERLTCRAARVDPTAALPEVLTVEILLLPDDPSREPDDPGA
jgi:hypothetical protein